MRAPEYAPPHEGLLIEKGREALSRRNLSGGVVARVPLSRISAKGLPHGGRRKREADLSSPLFGSIDSFERSRRSVCKRPAIARFLAKQRTFQIRSFVW
jgi:hypothetical protein